MYKSDEKLGRDMSQNRIFSRDFILDAAISLFCSLNYFALLINIVGFSTETFGATAAEAGLAAGVYVIGGLLARIFIGKYVELVGRKRMLIAGVSFALIMSIAYFWVSSLIMLYAVRLLHGLAYGVTSTCTNDIVSKLLPRERRGEGMGYFLLSVTFASAIGPLLGMELGATGDYGLVFSVGVVMYTLALICALLIHVKDEELTEQQISDAKSFRPENLIQKAAIPLAAICMVFYFAYSGVLSFIDSFSQETGMVTAATFFFVLISAGTLISRLTTGKIFDRKGPDVVMFPGYIAFIVGMLVYANTRSDILFLASGFVIGYGISIIYSVCQTMVINNTPPHRYGVTTSTFSAIVDLGSGMGPMILGVILPLTGFVGMYIMCAMIGVVSLLMYITFGRRYGKKLASGT